MATDAELRAPLAFAFVLGKSLFLKRSLLKRGGLKVTLPPV
jgi:hypothetical protein